MLPDIEVAPRQRNRSAPMALMDLVADVESFGVQQHGQVDSVAICADENHSFESEDIGQQDSIENILRLLEFDGRSEDPAVPNAV